MVLGKVGGVVHPHYTTPTSFLFVSFSPSFPYKKPSPPSLPSKPNQTQGTTKPLFFNSQDSNINFWIQILPMHMAHMRMEMCVVVVVMAILCAGAAAQSSCTNVLVSLSPCLNYITGNSSTPSSGCCSQLSSVVRSQPECLCQVLNGGGSSLGLNINQTQALALPAACKVQTPPTSRCKAAASPGDSPAADSPNSVPSGTGSKRVPSTDNGSSDGDSIKLSIPLLFIGLAATYASTFRTY